ncbi:MAG: hypothetical protein ACJAVK_003138, partial [Akkermansiaceae bacterium]
RTRDQRFIGEVTLSAVIYLLMDCLVDRRIYDVNSIRNFRGIDVEFSSPKTAQIGWV